MAARIERAILKGTALDLVQTRTMFTARLSNDTAEMNGPAWETYIESVFTPVLAIICNVWSTSTVELQYLESGHYITYEERVLSITGSNTGEPSPNYVAVVLIAKAIGLHALGRKYFTGIPKAIVDGNALLSTHLVGFGNALAAYITPMTGVGMSDVEPGIVDKNFVFHPFVGGQISAFLGTMRRRKPGLGM